MKKVLYEIVELKETIASDIVIETIHCGEKLYFRKVPDPNPLRKFEEGSMPKEGQKIILLCKNDEGGYWCFMTSFAEHGNWRDKSVVGYILFTPPAEDEKDECREEAIKYANNHGILGTASTQHAHIEITRDAFMDGAAWQASRNSKEGR